MIDDLRALAIFAKVAEAGSFSAAGRALRLSTSVVSHHVKALEERQGVTLLYRSTRSLSLTADGKQLLEAAQRMVAAAQDGFSRIADVSSQPAGSLRISAPTFLLDTSPQSIIWDFAKSYPNVAMTLVSSDENVNLIADGFDVAIRMGTLADSNLKTRKIGQFQRLLVAAPSYLETCRTITTPADLQNCEFILADMLQDNFSLINGQDHSLVLTDHSQHFSQFDWCCSGRCFGRFGHSATTLACNPRGSK